MPKPAPYPPGSNPDLSCEPGAHYHVHADGIAHKCEHVITRHRCTDCGATHRHDYAEVADHPHKHTGFA